MPVFYELNSRVEPIVRFGESGTAAKTSEAEGPHVYNRSATKHFLRPVTPSPYLHTSVPQIIKLITKKFHKTINIYL